MRLQSVANEPKRDARLPQEIEAVGTSGSNWEDEGYPTKESRINFDLKVKSDHKINTEQLRTRASAPRGIIAGRLE
jgi:hypothetical protein